jgi:hypothetical protein
MSSFVDLIFLWGRCPHNLFGRPPSIVPTSRNTLVSNIYLSGQISSSAYHQLPRFDSSGQHNKRPAVTTLGSTSTIRNQGRMIPPRSTSTCSSQNNSRDGYLKLTALRISILPAKYAVSAGISMHTRFSLMQQLVMETELSNHVEKITPSVFEQDCALPARSVLKTLVSQYLVLSCEKLLGAR